MTVPAISRAEADLPLVVTTLMKGVLYRDGNERTWGHLMVLGPQVRDYVATMGLTAVVSEDDGYAFLRSLPDTTEDGGTERVVPRLVARRALSFHVSLLIALLRGKLAEFDAMGGDSRLILTRDQIVELIRIFLPASTNEARLVDQVDATIGKIVDLGFLTRIRGQNDTYEVRRILKAFVDAQWLADFDTRLDEYLAELTGSDRT